jgi:HD superfamily phosphohydrolase YqeK
VTAGLEALRAEVAPRLSPERLAHVESVAETAVRLAAAWPAAIAEASLRAAWIHDALKDDGLDLWLRAIEEAGWQPDPWSLAHAPELLHAQAAAAWASARGETDCAVLDAVCHHPTAHPEWDVVGRILYVADFTEPTRRFAETARTVELRALAGEGAVGLAEAARRILRSRIDWLVAHGSPVHPVTLDAWNAWTKEVHR